MLIAKSNEHLQEWKFEGKKGETEVEKLPSCLLDPRLESSVTRLEVWGRLPPVRTTTSSLIWIEQCFDLPQESCLEAVRGHWGCIDSRTISQLVKNINQINASRFFHLWGGGGGASLTINFPFSFVYVKGFPKTVMQAKFDLNPKLFSHVTCHYPLI